MGPPASGTARLLSLLIMTMALLLGRQGNGSFVLVSRLERLGLGILTRSCPPDLVDRVVGEAGSGEKRRRLLSARFTVYFVLGLCLFPRVDYP
ncbi:transposase domain-containing protein [Streptomyces sp. NPDC059070]|uniref:transposase domain-containing protein n=1 Tax=unclassified Streptomyces TaxID=2593676 RepID=UPI0034E1F54B